MLTYWTTRYLGTLFVGLIVIGVISSIWLNYHETEKRLNFMKLMVEDIADRAVDTDGNLRVGPYLMRIIDGRQRIFEMNLLPFLLITDRQGQLVYGRADKMTQQFLDKATLAKLENHNPALIALNHDERFYVAIQEMIYEGKVVGKVYLFSPEKEIVKSNSDLSLLFILLGSLALLGWLVIYLFTRKLSDPIQKVADAAKRIVTGDYHIQLQQDIREKEMYELIDSFKEMADRLRQLEEMRTELLAGVTHELKTPVTSISGLVQAVKDEVVTGEEAKEFLNICAKETGRLQKMVEDLLDFNSFAIGDIRVSKEEIDMNMLIQEITHQWLISQEEDAVQLSTWVPGHSIMIATDPLRVQQILYNLLNNAKQSTIGNGRIEVTLQEAEEGLRINVKDNGMGVPPEEQPLIFERFYRGEEKKHRVRGLGLGLPFSKLMARALGGDLRLQESSSQGTTFTFTIGNGSNRTK